MKNSNYNIYVKINSKEYIIYNTLNQTLITINDEKLKKIKENKFDELNNEEICLLINNGIIVDDECNELDIYKYKRNLAQFNFKKLHILYTITDACNSDCEYCFKKNDKVEKVDKEKKESIKKFIINQAQLNECKEIQIDFFGGEPLILYKEVIKDMNYFNKWADDNKINIQYRFYTNGTILNEQLLEYFKENKRRIKDLQITLDGPKEVHDKVRPLKNKSSSYDLIMKNLKMLNEAQIPVQIRINFNSENYVNVEKCIDDLKKNKLDNIPIYFYAVQAMSSACAKYELAITDNDTLKVFPKLWKDAVKRKLNINLKQSPGFVYCSASCKSTFVINYKGEVYKCALLQTDKKYKIGEISEDGKLKYLSNEYFKWMSKTPLDNKKCTKCKLLPVCGGGCGGSAAEKYGNYLHENCFDMNMKLFKTKLKLYYKQRYE